MNLDNHSLFSFFSLLNFLVFWNFRCCVLPLNRCNHENWNKSSKKRQNINNFVPYNENKKKIKNTFKIYVIFIIQIFIYVLIKIIKYVYT